MIKACLSFLLRIFSFLDVVTLCRCAQVSRAWNVLALDGSNWQRIDLFDFQRDIEGRVVENISKRCGGFLRKLSLRGCLGVGDNALRTFAQNCRNIEVLSLNGCTKTTDATCTSLSKFCSKLRHLDLASCTSITNMSLKALSEGCPLLEQLNISWCDQVTKDGIQALVRGCGGLKALFLKGCTQVMLCVVLVKVRGTVSSYRFSQDGCPGDSGSWRCYCESTLPKVRTVCLELRTINI